MANSVDPDQTVCSRSTLFASILNSSVMLGNYLQQTTFSDAFFLGALRVKFFHYGNRGQMLIAKPVFLDEMARITTFLFFSFLYLLHIPIHSKRSVQICSMFCCVLLCVHSSFAITLKGKRELVALLCLSSWCLVIVV